jgi:hypothetical protein
MAAKKSKSKKKQKAPKIPHNPVIIKSKPVMLRSPKYFVEQARTYPFLGFWVDEAWKIEEDLGLARIAVARKQSDDRVAYAYFLVDTFCLGVKSVYAVGDVGLKSFMRGLKEFMDVPVECSVEWAHGLIYGAADYAAGFEFQPSKDFGFASMVLDPPGTYPIPEDLVFGKDGIPYFVPGPYDDTKMIVDTLQRTAGEGNFEIQAA